MTRLVADIAENYYALMALDDRLENLNRIIALQEQSLADRHCPEGIRPRHRAGVQRFQAEVRKNQSERLIINQQIIETENRINFLVGRFPAACRSPIRRLLRSQSSLLCVGVPAAVACKTDPISARPSGELEAAGLDVRVARANFFPKLVMTAGVGYEAFNTKYLFLTPESSDLQHRWQSGRTVGQPQRDQGRLSQRERPAIAGRL